MNNSFEQQNAPFNLTALYGRQRRVRPKLGWERRVVGGIELEKNNNKIDD